MSLYVDGRRIDGHIRPDRKINHWRRPTKARQRTEGGAKKEILQATAIERASPVCGRRDGELDELQEREVEMAWECSL